MPERKQSKRSAWLVVVALAGALLGCGGRLEGVQAPVNPLERQLAMEWIRAQIALATGFANQGHFGNQFRRRYGLPPGQARRDAGRRALVALLSR